MSRTDGVSWRSCSSKNSEVYDGLITIKGVVRIPGEKAKVVDLDDRIDPVGACVGMKDRVFLYRSRVAQREY